MWTLTPEYVEEIKEELKGRRAAIQARYADELKSIEADLADIETLERIAYAFAVKNLPEPAAPAAEPALELATLQPLLADPASEAAEPELESEPDHNKAASRWRMRLDATSESEPA
jgi:hypothetical protein